MSPLPKEFDPAMYKGMNLPLFDRLYAHRVTRELIHTKVRIQEPLHQKVTIDSIDYHMPQTVCVRGDSFLNFLSLVA
jgi:hypothetical protein